MHQLLNVLLLSLVLCSLPSASFARKLIVPVSGPVPEHRTAAVQGTARSVDDAAIGDAFRNRTSDIQVEGRGKVISLLSDDLNGSRHQRFLVRLASGQTLLIVHNIDIAPRIVGLKPGHTVRFYGEYIWNSKGGLIHWTHHDPQGRHVSGWVIHNGRTYQ